MYSITRLDIFELIPKGRAVCFETTLVQMLPHLQIRPTRQATHKASLESDV